MIISKELINRRYNDSKECTGFEYDLTIEDSTGQKVKQTFYFERQDDLDVKCWKVMTVVINKEFGELKPYNIEYMIPIKNMNLETVAATGLRHVQYLIQQELQYKSMIDFCIGDTINDM